MKGKKGGIEPMLTYKIDVIQALQDSGYTTYRIRQERIINESALQALRTGDMIGIKTLEKLCAVLQLQPGDIIGYTEERGQDD